jgi:hypothetical protein
MVSKKLEKEIFNVFGDYINKGELEQIINNTTETGSQEVIGFIVQFDKNKTTLNEFNETLKKINCLDFIVAGIIGSFIFAYKRGTEELDLNDKLSDIVKDKKIITFRVNVNIQYCGVMDIFNNIPYFLLPNEVFHAFDKIDFGNVYNLTI